MKAHFIILVASFFAAGNVSAQTSVSKVSLIGDDEVRYESIIKECPTLLLDVAHNSMDEAYDVWTSMLSDLEDAAEVDGIDLKGAKLWVNFFWSNDGSVKNVVYYPKPNSKNMDYDMVSKFLEDFSLEYQLPLTHETCFSHYGSASFPVHSKFKKGDSN